VLGVLISISENLGRNKSSDGRWRLEMATATQNIPGPPNARFFRDPLQTEQTPYDVLGITLDATSAEVDQAVAKGLVKRPRDAKKFTEARRILISDRPRRALIDLFYYSGAALSNVAENWLDDSAVLEPETRPATARVWARVLQSRFPDLDAAHCLAILHYWWALWREAQQLEGKDATPPLIEIWEKAIGCWSMLVASDHFWRNGDTCVAQDVLDAVRKTIEERLRTELGNLEQKHRRNGGAAYADLYRELELDLTIEMRAAALMANKGKGWIKLKTSPTPLCCGQLMLRHMGLLDSVRSTIKKMLNQHSSPALQALDAALSDLAKPEELIRRGKPDVALARLDRITAESERNSAEFGQLRALALYELGKQKEGSRDFEAALDKWEEALECVASEDVISRVKDRVVSTCVAQGNAMRPNERERGIALLEHGLRLVDDGGLKLSLAELLTERGIEHINEAQESAGPGSERVANLMREAHDAAGREDWDTAIAKLRNAQQAVPNGNANVRAAIQPGINDLQRAARLGSRRGQDQLAVALKIADGAGNGAADAISTIKKNLAVCLCNRANVKANEIFSNPPTSGFGRMDAIRTLNEARSDLAEARKLDPSGPAGDQLNQLNQIVSVLENPEGAIRSHQQSYSSNRIQSSWSNRIISFGKEWLSLISNTYYLWIVVAFIFSEKPAVGLTVLAIFMVALVIIAAKKQSSHG
jgi:tetratricopeptide (TPR) repeat protein